MVLKNQKLIFIFERLRLRRLRKIKDQNKDSTSILNISQGLLRTVSLKRKSKTKKAGKSMYNRHQVLISKQNLAKTLEH